MVLILSRGTRTSMIIDPPDGRIPPLTPEAEKTIAAKKEYLRPCCKAHPAAGRARFHLEDPSARQTITWTV